MGGGMEKNGEIAGIACGMWVVEGCGGMWLRKMGENGRKMGGKWDEIPIFYSPISPIFLELKIFPTVPFVKLAHRIHRQKNGIFCHSPTLTATAASADACSWDNHATFLQQRAHPQGRGEGTPCGSGCCSSS